MPFSRFDLSPEVIGSIEYSKPTDIQMELIPAILKGRDILASAQTGSGKTAGFSLPIIEKILRDRDSKESTLRGLIVVPTRELARQIHGHIERYTRYTPLQCSAIYGGKSISSQANRLKSGIDILVATPGRLLEHIAQKSVDIKSVEYFVLDEVDTMLDMGFRGEVTQIINSLKDKRQNILISATIPHTLKELSREILHRPISIEVSTMGDISSTIRQVLHPVDAEKKLELLSYLIGSKNYKQVLVFVRKRSLAQVVTEELIASGLKTVTIHGEKSSGARSRALSDFIDGKARVLVATDIAARGLDIKELDVVINYDIPHVTQDFIHRIGRTGRAGRAGLAITLSSSDESIALKSIERMLGKAIPTEVIDGYAPPTEPQMKGGRKNSSKRNSKTAGAFGKKRAKPTTKKRKTTKRDAFKSFDNSKKRR
ncbi:ATP-dependent RNA helicase RhlE [hydrothermal vent metagenome]|uniref:ATP-dependent RNA helicase RhlE n=1 Tax=hydrothermal vent metagenome TaxID=652676 RepID=A0A1W1C659_9ZZZZ